MELALLAPHAHSQDPADSLELPPALLRLMEGIERSLTSENSRRAYRTSLLQFFAWCRSSGGQSTFSRLSVLQYKDALMESMTETPSGPKRQFSPATINLRLAAVRALAQEAADNGRLDQSEAAAIRRVRGEKQTGSWIGNWLQKEQLDRLLTVVDRRTLRGKRDFALLAVLFATALRRRELVELDVTTIQERDGQWGFIGLRGKGGKVRDVSLPDWVRMALSEWLVATGIVQGRVFRSISRHGKLGKGQLSEESVKLILSHYATVCGYPSLRPHDARRTCARLCRSGAASLEDVQELLGHSSIQTTERYLGKTEGFKRAITNIISAPFPTV